MIGILCWIVAIIFLYYLLCEMVFRHPMDDAGDFCLFGVLYTSATAVGPVLMYSAYLMSIGVLS